MSQPHLPHTWLTGIDAMGSVLFASQGTATHTYAYSAFGEQAAPDSEASVLGFNGQRRDPLNGHYHLGNGYRSYSPALMQFLAPDSLSPFGSGGINPYAYCVGDPINRADPSGHMSWMLGVSIGIAALGLIIPFVSIANIFTVTADVAAITAEASTTASSSVLLAGAGTGSAIGGIVSGAITPIAALATEKTQPGLTKDLLYTLTAITACATMVLDLAAVGIAGFQAGARLFDSAPALDMDVWETGETQEGNALTRSESSARTPASKRMISRGMENSKENYESAGHSTHANVTKSIANQSTPKSILTTSRIKTSYHVSFQDSLNDKTTNLPADGSVWDPPIDYNDPPIQISSRINTNYFDNDIFAKYPEHIPQTTTYKTSRLFFS